MFGWPLWHAGPGEALWTVAQACPHFLTYPVQIGWLEVFA